MHPNLLALAAGAFLTVVGDPVATQAPDGGRFVVMPMMQSSPRMQFHQGEASDNQPLIPPGLPDLPGPASPYYVAQWNQAAYITAAGMVVRDPNTFDPRLGVAEYAFASSDGHSHLWIYRGSGSWVYELYEAGGTLAATGGSNLFLAPVQRPDAAMDHRVTVDFDSKLSKAAIAASAEAQGSGAVMSMYFAGMGFLYTDPRTRQQRFVFMQVPIASSRTVARQANFMCNGQPGVWLYEPALTHDEVVLPFAADAGPLRHVHYSINPYLTDLLTTKACGEHWTETERDPSNWRLSGFYLGLESESRDHRPGSPDPGAQGEVEMGVQIANISIVEYP